MSTLLIRPHQGGAPASTYDDVRIGTATQSTFDDLSWRMLHVELIYSALDNVLQLIGRRLRMTSQLALLHEATALRTRNSRSFVAFSAFIFIRLQRLSLRLMRACCMWLGECEVL